MKRALCLIPNSTNYHYPAWVQGIQKRGYTVVPKLLEPDKDDIVVMWNRSYHNEKTAKLFEEVGAKVLIAENGYLGKQWNGFKWFALSLNHHNGAGWFPKDVGASRVKRYNFILKDWQTTGEEYLALPQRGIGEPSVAMPHGWECKQATRTRPHLGPQERILLEDDILNTKVAITWGSGAAIKALANGVPVFYQFKDWIAKSAATHISDANWQDPQKPDRYPAFCDIFSAMWTLQEIESGEALKHYL